MGTRVLVSVLLAWLAGSTHLSAKTELLVDLAPGSSPASSAPDAIGSVGDRWVLFEAGEGPPSSTYLAASDGTSARTRPVVGCGGECRLWNPIAIGAVELSGRALVVANRSPGSFGLEFADLWSVDPARGEARLLRTAVGLIGWSTAAAGAVRTVVVVGGREVIETDGTALGTRSLESEPLLLGAGSAAVVGVVGSEVALSVFVGGQYELIGYEPTTGVLRSLGVLPGRLEAGIWNVPESEWGLFLVRQSGGGIWQLWRTNGSVTEMLMDLENLGLTGFGGVGGRGEGTLFLWFRTGPQTDDLMVSDGTVSGSWWAAPGQLTWAGVVQVEIGGRVLAFHGAEPDREPRLVDRSGASAKLDLCPGACSSGALPWPSHDPVIADGRVWLSGKGADGRVHLWTTDGSAAGTTDLGPLLPTGQRLGYSRRTGGQVFFTAHDEHPGLTSRLAAYDLGRRAVTTLHAVASGSLLGDGRATFWNVGSRLFFSGSDEATGRELWVSDGRVEGTAMVRDLAQGLEGSSSNTVAMGQAAAGAVVYRAGESPAVLGIGANGVEVLLDEPSYGVLGQVGGAVIWESYEGLWSSRGTAASTVRLPVPGASLSGIEVGDGMLLWVPGVGLWWTDGTTVGTHEVRALDGAPRWVGIDSDGRGVLIVSGGSDAGIWRSDGSRNGTTKSTDVVPQEAFSLWSGGELAWWDSGLRQVRSVVLQTGLIRSLWSAGATERVLALAQTAGSITALVEDGASAEARYGLRRITAQGQVGGLVEVPRPGGLPSGVKVVSDGTHGYFSTEPVWPGRPEAWFTDGTVGGTGPVPGGGLAAPVAFREGVVVGVGSYGVWALAPSGARLLAAFDDFMALVPARWASGRLAVLGTRGGSGRETWIAEVAATGPLPRGPEALRIRSGLGGPPPSESWVELEWSDRSANEEGFIIESRPAEGAWETVAVVAPNRTTFTAPVRRGSALSWRVVAANAAGRSVPSNVVGTWAPDGGIPASCFPDAETLCLGNGRYALKVRWRTEDGATGVGRPIGFDAAGTTGFFWFFDQANIELVVKMLDGAVLNDHDWLFAGALSNVEYWISAVDTLSGATRSYHNAPGNICGFADIDAFWKQRGGREVPGTGYRVLRKVMAVPVRDAAGGGPVGPGFEGASAPAVAESSLSLLGGRFRVEVSWKTPDGATGSGVAVPATDQSGYFWFFDQANLELVVKMLDGLGVNGHYWLFHGALSNVEYEIAVTDQVTSERKVWRNPQGTICGGADIEAF